MYHTNFAAAQGRIQLMSAECHTLQSSSTAATKLLLRVTLNLAFSAVSKPCQEQSHSSKTIHYTENPLSFLATKKRLCNNELSFAPLYGYGSPVLRFNLKIGFCSEGYQQHFNHRSV
jgi:hypothetical protein